MPALILLCLARLSACYLSSRAHTHSHKKEIAVKVSGSQSFREGMKTKEDDEGEEDDDEEAKRCARHAL